MTNKIRQFFENNFGKNFTAYVPGIVCILIGLLVALAPMILVIIISFILFTIGLSYIAYVRQMQKRQAEAEKLFDYIKRHISSWYDQW